MPAHAVVPQTPVVRQRPIPVEDPAYVEDLGSSSYQKMLRISYILRVNFHYFEHVSELRDG
jgi:hypothetical protein